MTGEAPKKNNLGQYLKTYPARAEIIKEGEENQDFFCLLEGSVGIYKEGDTPKSMVKIGDIDKKGSYFGEMGYLLKEPRTASIIAETEVKVLRFTGSMLPELILKQPNLGLKLCMTMAQRLKGTTANQRDASSQRDELRGDISKQHLALAQLFQKVFIMISSIQMKMNNSHLKAILSYMSQQKILRSGQQMIIDEAFLTDVPEELHEYIKMANDISKQSSGKDTPQAGNTLDLLKDD